MENRYEIFTSSVTELSRYVSRIKEMEMKKHGLKAGHTNVLVYLSMHPEGLTSAKLTALCREDKAAVSRNIADLLEKGFVKIEVPDGEKKYRAPIFLTENGRKLMLRIDECISEAVDYGGKDLSETERENLYASLKKILRNLSEYIDAKEEKNE